MIKLWNLFNNKKTVIGACCFMAAMAIQKLSGIWLGDTSPDWIPKTIETLDWFGAVFSGTGILHKGAKQMTEKKIVITK